MKIISFDVFKDVFVYMMNKCEVIDVKLKLINLYYFIPLVGYLILDLLNDLNKLNITNMLLYLTLLLLVFSIFISVKFKQNKRFRDFFVLFISICGLLFLILNKFSFFLIDMNEMFLLGYVLIPFSLLPFSFKNKTKIN